MADPVDLADAISKFHLPVNRKDQASATVFNQWLILSTAIDAELDQLREQLDAARHAIGEIANTPVLRRSKYAPNGYADNATKMRDIARAALGVEGEADDE
jgi:hypothetical protein